MGLIRPIGLAMMALVGVVVVLHMLRVDRREQRVPSTWLWQRLELDPPASRPWRRPPPSWLLALQIATVALLAAAFARPFFFTDRSVGTSLVVLLDQSASMAATDVEPDRMTEARRVVQERAEEAISAGALVTLVAFADDTEVLLSSSDDPATIRRALAGLRPQPSHGRLADALGLASALAEGQDDARMLVVTDGALDAEGARPPTTPLDWLLVGTGDDNQSVVALSIDPRPDGSSEAFVRVANHARTTARRRVLLESSGQLVDARDLSLPPGGDAAYVVPLARGADGALTARLAGDDLLAMDDAAYAVAARGDGARVSLVTNGNRFLETALSLLPGVDALTTVPADGVTLLGRADVVVADGAPPPQLAAPLLLVHPTASLAGIEVLGQLDAPVPIIVAPDHPLAVPGLDETAILDAAALGLGEGWLPLLVAEVEGRTWPLMAEGQIDGRPAIVVAFDLGRSDLPLRPAFPLWVAATLDHLAPTTALGLPASAAPGVPLALRLPPRVTSAAVLAPNGDVLSLDPAQSEVLWVPEAVGVHHLTLHAGQDEPPLVVPLAVNHALGAGSDVRGRPVVLAAPAAEAIASDDERRGRREMWRWLVGLALVLGSAEWWLDHRRSAAGALRRIAGLFGGDASGREAERTRRVDRHDGGRT